ncbi:sugar kinase [Halobacillus sp. MO56]
MKDVITIGDAMITFDPSQKGPMRYADSFKRKVGGAEMNFAIGCARLGLSTGWISRLGNDEFGKYIHNFVRGEGVDISSVRLVDGYPTSLNFKEIKGDGSGRTFYYRNNSPTNTLTKETIDEEVVKNTRLIHITGVFAAIDQEKNIDLIEYLLKLGKDNGALVSMDPNIRLKLWSRQEATAALTRFLPYVDILLTGEEEAEILFGTSKAEEVITRCKDHDITALAIKRGEKGAFGYLKGEALESSSIPPVKVVDTVGAGDGFDAGFVYGYLQDWPLKKILRFANTIGSMVVSVVGDNEGLPYLEEVLVQLGEKELLER